MQFVKVLSRNQYGILVYPSHEYLTYFQVPSGQIQQTVHKTLNLIEFEDGTKYAAFDNDLEVCNDWTETADSED